MQKVTLTQTSKQTFFVAFTFGLLASLGCNGSKNRTDLNEFQSIKDRSIALLENAAENDKEGVRLTEAADGFRKLAMKYPKDSLGIQNLCVTLFSRLKALDPSEADSTHKSLCQEYESSIATLRALKPQDPDADILLARYYQWRNDREGAIQALKRASKVENATSDVYFQLVQLLLSEGSAENNSEVKTLLESAIRLSPNNLVLAIAYLDALAKTKNIEFLAQLERCKKLFLPITSRTESPVSTLFERAGAAVAKEDWRVAQTQAAFLRNVLIAEIAFQNDLHLLDPHVLDFVQLEFNPSTDKPLRNAENATKQEFSAHAPWAFATANVTAIGTEDMDLDGHMDLVLNVNGRLEVWSFPKEATSESANNIMSMPIDIVCDGLTMADLDHDYQFRKDSLPPSDLPSTSPPGFKSTSQANVVDTDVDIIAYGKEGVRTIRNDLETATGKRTLTVVMQSEEFQALTEIKALAAIDFDHDSDLDLAIASKTGVSLWSNRGDWTFANFTSYSALPDESVGVDSILALDLDRNVLNDFLLGPTDASKPVMLANSLHGRYQVREVDWPKEIEKSCRAINVLDVNRDACWDLIMCGPKGTKLLTMKSVGRKSWLPDNVTSLSSRPMVGVLTEDFDCDGATDAVSWGEEGWELFRGTSIGKLEKDKSLSSTNQPTKHILTCDVDRDRDEDLILLQSDGSLRWVENRTGNRNAQLEVVIRADEDGKQRPRERCNMHGVGSLIELKSGGSYQAQIVRGTRTRFGIGQQKGADIMRVVWTNGIPNNVLNVSNKSTVFDQQNLGGSCPYLYAWNGERFEFLTDCLWAAPIGLQFAQGVAAPTREWEYLKLDGKNIQARDGKYVLQITEELWEAAYFDSVKLMAVDHPKDMQIYTNEKVGPAEIAEHRIYTVQNRRLPLRVTDQNGQDLSTLVSERDNRFTRCWSIGFNQGLVETHWLEIDMNDSRSTREEEGELVLFMTGWVFPTCTSLNLAMTENPTRPRLCPPSIQVPNENGEWQEVIPYAGFPGGKTKTVAIDLTGKFLCKDHRVRVVTNMELCWDEVFYTKGETVSRQSMTNVHSLKMTKADLHFRGFSELVARGGNAPKYYDYNRVEEHSLWPPMFGNFTRYGAVDELIGDADDLQVVLGAGDELTVEFSDDCPALPEGWTRDFLIFNIGWDKDADLNTIHGQNVEPLPFREMTKYPYAPDQSFPNSPRHLDFLNRYQTRTQDTKVFWNQVRDAL